MEAVRSFTTFLMCLSVMCYVSDAVDTSMLQRICNGDHFTQDTVSFAVEYVIYEITTNTPNQDGHEYYVDKYLDSDWTIRGHGVCTCTLSAADCSDCLAEAAKKLDEECRRSIGAQVQLEDCRIRYEKYHFNNDG
ncbi:hypothetical protein MLD38_026461 [Melastoma candidum]|uniref:Uncharacterized protein n=1 Tax=Melastoma candidum TaxID=119954 RepID=A0ACB9P1I1_9MYRT|nr:hypothetical protein MLD38_026461 [Melastoma candidum]